MLVSVRAFFTVLGCFAMVDRITLFECEQEHAERLGSRLKQREEELADAAILMDETRQDLTALRDRAKEAEQV